MNDLIKELAKESDAVVLKMMTGRKQYTFLEDDLERFVKSIIQECLLCCERVISDPVRKEVDCFLEGGIHCMDEIKYHFEIEQ